MGNTPRTKHAYGTRFLTPRRGGRPLRSNARVDPGSSMFKTVSSYACKKPSDESVKIHPVVGLSNSRVPRRCASEPVCFFRASGIARRTAGRALPAKRPHNSGVAGCLFHLPLALPSSYLWQTLAAAATDGTPLPGSNTLAVEIFTRLCLKTPSVADILG